MKSLSLKLDNIFIGNDFYYNNIIDIKTNKNIGISFNNFYSYTFVRSDFLCTKNQTYGAFTSIESKSLLYHSVFSNFIRYSDSKNTPFYYPHSGFFFFSGLLSFFYSFLLKKKKKPLMGFIYRFSKKGVLLFDGGLYYFIPGKYFLKYFSFFSLFFLKGKPSLLIVSRVFFSGGKGLAKKWRRKRSKRSKVLFKGQGFFKNIFFRRALISRITSVLPLFSGNRANLCSLESSKKK